MAAHTVKSATPAEIADVADLLTLAFSTDPAARWPSCAAMAAELRAIARRLGEPLHDHAIARMVNLRERLPTHPIAHGRARLARGTPAVVGVRAIDLPLAPPPTR